MKFEIKHFRVVTGANTLKATASVTLRQETLTPYGKLKNIHDTITIQEVKLVEGQKGLFLSMPTVKRGDKYWPVVVLEDEALKQQLEAELITLFSKKVGDCNAERCDCPCV